MAFWDKKNVDPWDVDPEKQKKERERAARKAARAEEPGLLDELKTWNEERKAKKEEAVPPRTCPWCGGEMTGGYLSSGRDSAVWSEERPGFLSGVLFKDHVIVCQGSWAEDKNAWLCKTCRKLVADVDAVEPPEYRYRRKDGEEPPDESGKACEEYQEQVKKYQ